MQMGCERCGFVENESDAYARHRNVTGCPACGAALVRMPLRDALALAREAAEAEAWRDEAKNVASAGG